MITELKVLRSGLQARMFPVCSSLLAAALLCLSASAHASNLIADSGFEAAGGGNVYFAGQSIDGGSWNVTQGAIYIDTQDPWVFNGNNSANLSFANDYAPNTLSETLTTVIGQLYQISFWANADTPNAFAFDENGNAVAGLPNAIAQGGFPNDTNGSLFTLYSGRF